MFLHLCVILFTGWRKLASQHASQVTGADTPKADTPEGDTPSDRHPTLWRQTPPPQNNHWSGWYASYWNAFLFPNVYFWGECVFERKSVSRWLGMGQCPRWIDFPICVKTLPFSAFITAQEEHVLLCLVRPIFRERLILGCCSVIILMAV